MLQSNSGTQFFDWNIELRQAKKLQDLVKKQLSHLSKRQKVTWIDVNSFYDEQIRGKNYGEEIRLPSSFEIFLKAENSNTWN